MSHFTVAVITDGVPTKDKLAETLMPWHEYECTGFDNEFVVEVDETGKYRNYFEEYLIDSAHSTFEEYLIDDGFREGPGGDYGFDKNEKGEITRVYRRTNPNKKWDWWQVGGRWSGSLLTKSGSGFKGTPGLMGSQTDPNGSDQCAVTDLDCEGIRARNVENRRRYLQEGLEELQEQHDISREQAYALWDEYCSAMRALQAEWESYEKDGSFYGFIENHELKDKVRGPISTFSFRVGLEYTDTDIDKWVEQAPSLTSYAVVVDGEWHEKGEMGWFGMSYNDKDQADWNTEFEKLLAAKAEDPNAWITMVDCHI